MKDFRSLIQDVVNNRVRQKKQLAAVISLSFLVSFTVPMVLTEPAVSQTRVDMIPSDILASQLFNETSENMIKNMANATANDNYSKRELSEAALLVGNGRTDITLDGTDATSAINAMKQKYLLGIAADFCVFLEDNFKPATSDCEGRIAVGGNIATPTDDYQIGAGDFGNGRVLTKTTNYEGISDFAHIIMGGSIIKNVSPYGTKNSGSTMIASDGAADEKEQNAYKRIVVPNNFTITDESTHKNDGGHVKYNNGCAHWGKVTINEEALFYQAELINFTNEFEHIRKQSQALENQSCIPATVDINNKVVTFDASSVARNSKVVYFSLDSDDIGNWDGYTFKFKNIPQVGGMVKSEVDLSQRSDNDKEIIGKTNEYPAIANIIINVKGTDIKIGGTSKIVKTYVSTDDTDGYYISNVGAILGYNATWSNNHPYSENLLYNFTDYNENDGIGMPLYIGANFNGTILAPNANATSKTNDDDNSCPGHLSGSLIAKSFEGGLEFGYRPYRGSVDIIPASSGYGVPIRKIISGTEIGLEGATFGIFEKVGNEENLVSSFNSGANGDAFVDISSKVNFSEYKAEDYTSGTTVTSHYIIKETKAPEGFVLDDSKYYDVTLIEEIIVADNKTVGGKAIPTHVTTTMTSKVVKDGEVVQGTTETFTIDLKDIYSYVGSTLKRLRREITIGADTFYIDMDSEENVTSVSKKGDTTSGTLTVNETYESIPTGIDKDSWGNWTPGFDVEQMAWCYLPKGTTSNINIESATVYYVTDDGTDSTVTTDKLDVYNLASYQIGGTNTPEKYSYNKTEKRNFSGSFSTINGFSNSGQNNGDSGYWENINIPDTLKNYSNIVGITFKLRNNGAAVSEAKFAVQDKSYKNVELNGKSVYTFAIGANEEKTVTFGSIPTQLNYNKKTVQQQKFENGKPVYEQALDGNKQPVFNITYKQLKEDGYLVYKDSSNKNYYYDATAHKWYECTYVQKTDEKTDETTTEKQYVECDSSFNTDGLEKVYSNEEESKEPVYDENKPVMEDVQVNDVENGTFSGFERTKVNNPVLKYEYAYRQSTVNTYAPIISGNDAKKSCTVSDYRYDAEKLMILPLQQHSPKFENKHGLLFQKIDSNGRPLSGATIELYKYVENGTDEEVNFGWDNTKSTNITIDISKLGNDIYYFKEAHAPDGYEKAKNIYFKVSSDSVYYSTNLAELSDNDFATICSKIDISKHGANDQESIKMKDYQIGGASLNLFKVDNTDHNMRLSGSRFVLFKGISTDDSDSVQIYPLGETTGFPVDKEKGFDLLEAIRSAGDGTYNPDYFVDGYLIPGNYYLVEKESPTGYNGKNAEFRFSVSLDRETNKYVITPIAATAAATDICDTYTPSDNPSMFEDANTGNPGKEIRIFPDTIVEKIVIHLNNPTSGGKVQIHESPIDGTYNVAEDNTVTIDLTQNPKYIKKLKVQNDSWSNGINIEKVEIYKGEPIAHEDHGGYKKGDGSNKIYDGNPADKQTWIEPQGKVKKITFYLDNPTDGTIVFYEGNVSAVNNSTLSVSNGVGVLDLTSNPQNINKFKVQNNSYDNGLDIYEVVIEYDESSGSDPDPNPDPEIGGKTIANIICNEVKVNNQNVDSIENIKLTLYYADGAPKQSDSITTNIYQESWGDKFIQIGNLSKDHVVGAKIELPDNPEKITFGITIREGESTPYLTGWWEKINSETSKVYYYGNTTVPQSAPRRLSAPTSIANKTSANLPEGVGVGIDKDGNGYIQITHTAIERVINETKENEALVSFNINNPGWDFGSLYLQEYGGAWKGIEIAIFNKNSGNTYSYNLNDIKQMVSAVETWSNNINCIKFQKWSGTPDFTDIKFPALGYNEDGLSTSNSGNSSSGNGNTSGGGSGGGSSIPSGLPTVDLKLGSDGKVQKPTAEDAEKPIFANISSGNGITGAKKIQVIFKDTPTSIKINDETTNNFSNNENYNAGTKTYTRDYNDGINITNLEIKGEVTAIIIVTDAKKYVYETRLEAILDDNGNLLIPNERTGSKIDITAKKLWKDDEDFEGAVRPREVTFKLTRQYYTIKDGVLERHDDNDFNEKADNTKVLSGPDWQCKWEGLDRFVDLNLVDSKDNTSQHLLDEHGIIAVCKDEAGNIFLYPKDNYTKWEEEIDGTMQNVNYLNTYFYQVAEVKPNKPKANDLTDDEKKLCNYYTENSNSIIYNEAGTVSITNELIKTSINATKTWGCDESNKSLIPPELKVTLQYRTDDKADWVNATDKNGEKITCTLEKVNDTKTSKGTFTGLPAHLQYRIVEDEVPTGWKFVEGSNNTASGNDNEVGISNEIMVGSLNISKSWNDDESIDSRPDNIKVKLYRSTENTNITNTEITNVKETGDYDNYAKALQYSLYFYDANMCGDIVDETTGKSKSAVIWRGDCHANDPVSGGFHDAGDHIVYGLANGFTASTLGWNYYEFKNAYDSLGQTEHYQNIMKQFCKYFIASYDENQNKLLLDKGTAANNNGNSGKDGIDHAYWGTPESQTNDNRSFVYGTDGKGSDVAAQYAASLALYYINFKDTDPTFANQCYTTAVKLYDYATKKGWDHTAFGYSNQAADECASEQAWASLWLYLATIKKGEANVQYKINCDNYLASTGDNDYGSGYYYGYVKPGVWSAYALTGDDKYNNYIVQHIKNIVSEDEATSAKPAYKCLDQWGSARHNTLLQTLILSTAKNIDFENEDDYVNWCAKQMQIMLGDNNLNNSIETGEVCLITGYNNNSVKHPHHRAASVNKDNNNYAHTLVGALAGGPQGTSFAGYPDNVENFTENEVAIDYQAGFTSAAAGLYALTGKGTTDVTISVSGIDNSKYDQTPVSAVAYDEFNVTSAKSTLEIDMGDDNHKLVIDGATGVEWNVSGNAVEVSANGVITTKDWGTAELKATVDETEYKVNVTVNRVVVKPKLPENKEFVKDLTLNPSNWSATVRDLPIYDSNGRRYYYYIEEIAIGTEGTVNGKGCTYYPLSYTGNGVQLTEAETKSMSVTNKKFDSEGVEMPSSGGCGTTRYYLTGAFIISLAGVYYLFDRRRRTAK